jgi:hypothetical protein
MLYIFLNNIWQDWDYVHNSLGYSNQETETVSFKKADYDYWGQSYLNTGFHDGNFSDPLDGTYWADGIVGWYDINQLALNAGLFPSNAQTGPNVIRQKESGVSTQTVVLIDANQTKKYLLRGLLELGWLTAEEVEAAGWSFGIPLCGVLTEIDDKAMNGTIPDRISIGKISSPRKYLTSNTIPESGVIEEYVQPVPPLEILSGIQYSNGNFAPRFITSYYDNILMPTTQADADAITSFGLTLQNVGMYGPHGAVRWDDSYTFEPIAVYTDIDGTNEYTDVDVNGLYCVEYWAANNSVTMRSQNDYWGSQVMTWRCRITKK